MTRQEPGGRDAGRSGEAQHDAGRRSEGDARPQLPVEPAVGAAEVDGVDGLLWFVDQYDARGEVAADEPVPDVAVAEGRAEIHVVPGPPGVGEPVGVVAEPVAPRGGEEIGGEGILGAPRDLDVQEDPLAARVRRVNGTGEGPEAG